MKGKEAAQGTVCLYPGDPRACVMLGKQQKPGTETRIRKSCFVFSVPADGQILLFHTLTRKLLLAPPEAMDILEDGKLIPASGLETEWTGKLYEDHFLVPEDTEEEQIYLELKEILVLKEELPKSITHYVILPTTTCNARCFYCFEQGMNYRKMSAETAEDTLRFILAHKPQEAEKKIHIHWFGGEPLCAPENIDRICAGLEAAGVGFTSEMTSNGSLFTEETAKKAAEIWKVRSVQITLDGMAEEYARRKRYSSAVQKPFETVIRSIHLLLAAGIRVQVRLNADEDNLEEIYRVIDYLRTEFTDEERKRMIVYAHSLFSRPGESLDDCPAGSGSDRLEEQVLEINREIRHRGMRPFDLSSLFTFKTHYCMVTAPECNVLIDAEGQLFACDAMPEYMRYGDVRTGIDPEAWKRVTAPCGVREECRRCAFLPQCTEFDRCPNRTAYDDCRRQEKRSLEQDLMDAYAIYRAKQQEQESKEHAD